MEEDEDLVKSDVSAQVSAVIDSVVEAEAEESATAWIATTLTIADAYSFSEPQQYCEPEESSGEKEELPAFDLVTQDQTKPSSPPPAQPQSITLSNSSTQIISQTTTTTSLLETVNPTSQEPPLPLSFSEDPLPSPSQEPPQSDIEAEAHEYVVEEILDKKLDANGEVKLLVKWENYPPSHNTWEPLDNLRDCDEVVQKYEIKRAQRLAKLYGGVNFYGEGSSKMNGDTASKKDKRHPEYKVSEVIGLTKVKDQKYFLVNLQDDGGSAYIRSSLANKLFPCKVIDFYMKHITWKKPT